MQRLGQCRVGCRYRTGTGRRQFRGHVAGRQRRMQRCLRWSQGGVAGRGAVSGDVARRQRGGRPAPGGPALMSAGRPARPSGRHCARRAKDPAGSQWTRRLPRNRIAGSGSPGRVAFSTGGGGEPPIGCPSRHHQLVRRSGSGGGRSSGSIRSVRGHGVPGWYRSAGTAGRGGRLTGATCSAPPAISSGARAIRFRRLLPHRYCLRGDASVVTQPNDPARPSDGA